jgi:pimeloyl-ACP methyl ester carboxylesterase
VNRGELESLGRIGAATVARPGGVARDVHTAVASRVFKMLGPLSAPVRPIHDRLADACYRGADAMLGAPIRAAGNALAGRRDGGSPIGDSPIGGVALGAVNGFFGDRLSGEHPDLAIDLELRRRGRRVQLDRDGLSASYPDATPRIAVFVHGLCETEAAWGGAGGPAPSFGSRLRGELGYTPLYVRYNSGEHVSDNGRRLSETLEAVVAHWPCDVEEIALVGHSMGGLVARSACRYGEQGGSGWTDLVRHVFCLGTPHLGAPMERAASVAGWALSRIPESRPFADLFFNGRSAGIKDLRYGNCVEEDWAGYDPDEFLRDRCTEVPFLDSATYYFVGATVSRRPDGLGGLIGDLLVSYPSASGNGRRRIPFEVEHGRHVGGLHHMQLLRHPSVYAVIREWLDAAERPIAQGEAAILAATP